jgi:hypothetical protein
VTGCIRVIAYSPRARRVLHRYSPEQRTAAERVQPSKLGSTGHADAFL